jgi:hypothetical protein
MGTDRKAYLRAYYEAHKDERKAKRKKQPRTHAALAAEARYREKMRVQREIEAMQFGPAAISDSGEG